MTRCTASAAFRVTWWAGVAQLLVLAVLLAVLPRHAGELPRGFRTPILAFELARTHAEVEALFGPMGSNLRARLARGMDLGNRVDFAFMVTYCAFFGSFALGAARAGARACWFAVAAAPIAALADVFENLQLFSITEKLGGDYDVELGRLAVFTWTKWELLGVSAFLFGAWLVRGSPLERTVGVFGILTGVLGVAAFVSPGPFAESFNLALSVTCVGCWVVARRRSAPAGSPVRDGPAP